MVSPSITLLAALAFATSAFAHMEMTYPFPFRSKYNPANGYQVIDYSMTAPLGDYPCKGYIDPSAPSVATWEAGSTVKYTIGGTAVHGGGSCQLAMSYDDGASWNVIYSIIGGCLIDGLTEDVEIPADAPSGEALFAWNWFNLLGNREMYQNCAPVTITNGGKGLDATKYPAPFVANVDAAPGCHTIEGTEVVFPNPGVNVRYGGKYAGTVPAGGTGITGTCNIVTAPPVASPAPVKEQPTSTSSSATSETLSTPSASKVEPVASSLSSAAAVTSASSAASSVMPQSSIGQTLPTPSSSEVEPVASSVSSAAAVSSASSAASSVIPQSSIGQTVPTPSSSKAEPVASSVSSAAAISSASSAASSVVPQSSIGHQYNADPTISSDAATATPSASIAASAPKCKRRIVTSKRHERFARRGGHGSQARLVRRRVHRETPAE